MASFRSLLEPRSLGILALCGIVCAAITGWQWWSESRRIGRAVPVEAEILTSGIEDETVGTGTSGSRQWRPVVTYRYTIGGETLVSDAVTPLNKGGDRSWAEGIAARFRPGEVTTAWVDPDAPEDSFLVAVRAWKPRAGVAAGLVLFLGAGFGWWRSRRRRRHNRAAT